MSRATTLKLITAVVTAVVSGLYVLGALDTLEAQLSDRFFTPQDSFLASDIIIVDIDEASLNALGQWPFARDVHAELLHAIREADVVAFDILFTEPASEASEDLAFGDALRAFAGRAVLAAAIDEQSGRLLTPSDAIAAPITIGFSNIAPDRDGVVRVVSLTRGEQMSFDAAVSAETELPESARVYYYGPATTFTTLSYSDVHAGALPASLFAGKTVLVGASAAGLGDTYQTPFGAMAGVEIHANILSTIAEGKYVQKLPVWAGLLALAFVGLLAYLVVTKITRPRWLYIALGVVFVGIILDAYLAFALGWLIPHLYEVILFVFLSGLLLLVQFVFEGNERRFIKRGFEQYVATEVVEEIEKNPAMLALGGETRTLSILFSDIRGFTTISEQLTPQELMQQLNEYLEEMSEAVMKRRGLVDKYIGDAVMAFWGAPLQNERHPIDAACSVVDMHTALASLNERWAREGRPAFQIGVGISTGDVVVGNMGSKRRFNYSIIGDEVNFAARIEGLTKQYGVFCLIGEGTYQAIKDVSDLYTRELDDVMVKGKLEPRRIYELLPEAPSEAKRAALEQFATGRAAYLAGNFKEAIAAFEKALEMDPSDGPSRVFLERSESLQATSPANWNGVFEFTSK